MEDRYLFRAKRIDNGEWIVGDLTQNKFLRGMRSWISSEKYDPKRLRKISKNMAQWRSVEVDPSTICQCTGIKDKNGKLIWEKDIVDGHVKRGAAFLNCLVLWNESKARFDVRAKGCNFPMTLDEVAGDMSVGGLDYEVVGNRFDNPELLELLEV